MSNEGDGLELHLEIRDALKSEPKPMPTHKSAREILNPLINLPTEFAPEKYIGRTCMICGFPFDKEVREKAVTDALAQLAELVRQEKKNEAGNINWNLACEHIAQKLEGKNEL